MNERQHILSLQKGESLITSLMNAGFAFAAWRMPEEQEITLIISTQNISKYTSGSLKDMDVGFLINAYEENHPIKPYYIPADIILTHRDEVQVHPAIKSSAIDEFLSTLRNAPPRKTIQDAPSIPSNDFEQLVSKAKSEIALGTFEKVVLSRFRDKPLPDSFSAWDFFKKMTNAYPGAFCSLSFVPDCGLWIGASPELLLSDTKHQFKTVSLAATKKLEKEQPLSEIAWTQKEIEEQAMVSRYIINCFKKIRLREFDEHGPKTVRAGNLAHLKTEFLVDYGALAFDDLADQMLELLHPTSAICGMPIEAAKPWIETHECYDREFYAGFLGPVNFRGDTTFFVNLRCMKVKNQVVRFFAGAGITEDSDPKKEYEETGLKMEVMNRIFE